MDDQTPKHETGHLTTEQDTTEDEVRRAHRELMAYFRGRRSHREALAALKTIKRFVRAQKKQHATVTVAMPSVRSGRKARKAGA